MLACFTYLAVSALSSIKLACQQPELEETIKVFEKLCKTLDNQ
jgi:hypothetical protein